MTIGPTAATDRAASAPTAGEPAFAGVASGLAGVAIFSVTLPATRIAVATIDPWVVGTGRAVVAALLAIAWLVVARAPFPRSSLPRLAGVAACVVFGFPLLTSFAMRGLPASHGAIVIGLLPLATAAFAVVFAHERPSRGFWIPALAGSASVVGYALVEGGGSLAAEDLLLVGAVAFAGAGYAEGGRLARTIGGPAVIAWALVVALPFALAATAWRVATIGATLPSIASAAAFGYLSVGSMFVGFLLWYRGLAVGGVARVGQLQLLQPFLSVAAAAVVAGEPIAPRTIAFAIAVVACVAIGRRFAVVPLPPVR